MRPCPHQRKPRGAANATGEIVGVATIHQVEERDDAEFVKVFAAGVSASYELSKTAQRVFQVVLDQYQRTPMNRGYADHVNLFWFDDGIEWRDVGMSEKTFQRGLKELLEKRFLHPKGPTAFWTNPALFFKGDRVMFVKEYRRRKNSAVQDECLNSTGVLGIERDEPTTVVAL